jgi:hydrogenase maturation factor
MMTNTETRPLVFRVTDPSPERVRSNYAYLKKAQQTGSYILLVHDDATHAAAIMLDREGLKVMRDKLNEELERLI